MAHPRIPISVAVVVVVVSISLSMSTLARELRPSEHGLENQSDPPSSTEQMQSFFAAASTPPDLVALPKPTDSSDPDWWKNGDRRNRGGSVKEILLITSIVCGISGVVFLAASVLFFIFRSSRVNRPPPSTQLAVKSNDSFSLVCN